MIVVPYVEEDLGNGVFKNRKANGQYYYYSKNDDGSIKDYYFFDGENYTAIKYEEVGSLDGVTIYALVDVNGEYILGLDPDNYNTLEEYIAHHFPELLEEEIKELQNDEDIIKENFYEG